ncbi:MAG: hypothetical protein IKD78_06935 [Bacteroidales bacterium]|nr:hypothetical protein [Bacteroidales bacterium]
MSRDGVENAPIGRVFFRGSFWASYSLTWTAAGDCALFLCRDRNRGLRETAKWRQIM